MNASWMVVHQVRPESPGLNSFTLRVSYSVFVWLWSWSPIVSMLISHSFPFIFHAIYISPCFFGLIVLLGSGASSSLLFGSVLLESCRLRYYYWILVWCCPCPMGFWFGVLGSYSFAFSSTHMSWSSNFWVCWRIPVMWPFKWSLLGSNCIWHHLFSFCFVLYFCFVFSALNKMKFGMFLEFWCLALLEVKG